MLPVPAWFLGLGDADLPCAGDRELGNDRVDKLRKKPSSSRRFLISCPLNGTEGGGGGARAAQATWSS